MQPRVSIVFESDWSDTSRQGWDKQSTIVDLHIEHSASVYL